MDIKTKITFLLELTVEEFRLVSRALGNRLEREEDIQAAKNLDNKIAQLRVTIGEQHYREVCKLKENLQSSEKG